MGAYEYLPSVVQQAVDSGSAAAQQVVDGIETAANIGAEAVQSGVAYGNSAAQQAMEVARDGATYVEGQVEAGLDTARYARDVVARSVEEASGVARGSYDWATTSKEELANDPQVQANILKSAESIPNQDIIYEQLAHNLAYGKADVGQLATWGYGPPEVVIPLDKTTGMYLVAVRPLKSLEQDVNARAAVEKMHGKALRPVLCFRGSTDAVDWADDMSPEGVGAFQFSAHEGDIAGAIAGFSGCDTTGHSLGGALAMLAATLGGVNRVVTFQAPGISEEALADPDLQATEATHHRAANDVVGWAGDGHMDGKVYVHDNTTINPVTDPGSPHTAMLLTGLNDLRGEDGVEQVYDGSVYNTADVQNGPANGLDPAKVAEYERQKERGEGNRATALVEGAPDWDDDGNVDGWEQAYADGREYVAEWVRWGVGSSAREIDQYNDGGATEGLGNLGSGLSEGDEMQVDGQQMAMYTKLWPIFRSRCLAGESIEALEMHLARTDLDFELQERMLKQLESLDGLGYGSQ